MIIVDSSVWIDFFSPRKSKATEKLNNLILEEFSALAIVDLCLTEILQGIQDENKAKVLADQLLSFTIITQHQLPVFLHAAHIYRTCRKKGVTVSSPVDTLLASIALLHDHEIFTLDKDFGQIAKLFPLKLMQW